MLLAAFDGVPEFIDLIRQGKIVASGMQQPYLIGVRAAQAMSDHLDGKTPPKEILVLIIVVSQKNLDEELPTITQIVSMTCCLLRPWIETHEDPLFLAARNSSNTANGRRRGHLHG